MRRREQATDHRAADCSWEDCRHDEDEGEELLLAWGLDLIHGSLSRSTGAGLPNSVRARGSGIDASAASSVLDHLQVCRGRRRSAIIDRSSSCDVLPFSLPEPESINQATATCCCCCSAPSRSGLCLQKAGLSYSNLLRRQARACARNTTRSFAPPAAYTSGDLGE